MTTGDEQIVEEIQRDANRAFERNTLLRFRFKFINDKAKEYATTRPSVTAWCAVLNSSVMMKMKRDAFIANFIEMPITDEFYVTVEAAQRLARESSVPILKRMCGISSSPNDPTKICKFSRI